MTIFVILLVLVLAFAFRSAIPQLKGVLGEQNTAAILSLLDRDKYHVINNVVLQSGNYTSQIDHVVVSDYGIFVIETKNYKGWIVGNENDEYWTQVIYQRKERLYNPLRQNAGHIRALESCLAEYPYLSYHSIVVFNSRAELKVNTHKNVIYTRHLVSTIRSYNEVKISEADKHHIHKKILESNKAASFNKRAHIKEIKTSIQKREHLKRSNLCPLCGSSLILREGKYGKFLGCSSYPRCKYTKKEG